MQWTSLSPHSVVVSVFHTLASPGPSFQEGILANLMITGKATSFNDRAPKKNSPSSPSGRWGWHQSAAVSAHLLQQQRARPCSVRSVVYGKNGLSAVVASTETPSCACSACDACDLPGCRMACGPVWAYSASLVVSLLTASAPRVGLCFGAKLSLLSDFTYVLLQVQVWYWFVVCVPSVWRSILPTSF